MDKLGKRLEKGYMIQSGGGCRSRPRDIHKGVGTLGQVSNVLGRYTIDMSIKPCMIIVTTIMALEVLGSFGRLDDKVPIFIYTYTRQDVV